MSKPVAVLISDIHYSPANLELADNALRQAIKKANELDVPVWICGDLHDTKAIIRAECLNALTDTLCLCNKRPRILRGNHDSLNEKSEIHALQALDGTYAEIISTPIKTINDTHFIPYFSDSNALRIYLSGITKKSLLIMHQGISGSNMGDYIVDRSAIHPIDVAGHRVISGHYHARQTIHLPDGGVWDYIGSPYTMSYGEAKDPEKGFQVLMDDGALEFIPTNLRKHVVHECSSEDTSLFLKCPSFREKDLLWIKVRDTKEKLQGFTKNYIRVYLSIQDTQDFRLDLIPTDTTTTAPKTNLSKSDIMDSLIDSLTNTSDDCKARLRDKWKSMI